MDIKDPIKNYADQKHIDTTRIEKILAATLQYDLYILIVIRFLGGNYTVEYRDTKSIITLLTESRCNEQIIEDLKILLEVGCPNKMNASSLYETFLNFLRYGDHSSIDKDIDKSNKKYE